MNSSALNPEEIADEMARVGASLDEIARKLLECGFGPITTMKAMRSVTGMALRDLRLVLDRVQPPEVRDEHDRLRALAEAILLSDPESQD